MKKIDLRKSAEKAVKISSLMEGRTKHETRELIGAELTLDQVDIVRMSFKGKPSEYAVVTFKEEEFPGYYSGGMILTKIVKSMLEDVESLEELNILLREQDVKIRLTYGTTGEGNRITLTEVL